MRRAVTLLEMLVVIAVSTVLLGVAVSVLHLLMRAESGGRRHVVQTTAVAQLADQFRSDVRAALRPIAAEGAPKNQWQFALSSQRTVTYRALPNEIERREQSADKLERRESYTLPPECSVEITVGGQPAMASLVIKPGGLTPSLSHEIRVEAALGADHRFVKSAKGGQ